jgi:virulence-associated protein VagC
LPTIRSGRENENPPATIDHFPKKEKVTIRPKKEKVTIRPKKEKGDDPSMEGKIPDRP